MKKIALSLATLAAISCSLQIDSQYGLRWEPTSIFRNQDNSTLNAPVASRLVERLPEMPSDSEPLGATERNSEHLIQKVDFLDPVADTQTFELHTLSEAPTKISTIDDDTKPVSNPQLASSMENLLSTSTIVPGGPDFLFGFRLLINVSLFFMLIGGLLLYVGWALGESATLWGGIIFGIGALGFVSLALWWLFIY